MANIHWLVKSALLCTSIFPTISFSASDLDSALSNPNNWAHQRGGYHNHGYSTLNQINANNVKDLKLAWTFSTGVNRGHEGAPLVVDGVMYLHTAFPNNVYALDLNNDQKIIWSYFPKQDTNVQAMLCCDNVNRGLAFGGGKIYLQQNDGVLVALNAKSGQVEWQVEVNDPKSGATNTNAPMVVKDKVLTGCAGGEFGVRCFMAAYYIKDGQLAWKAYSTGPDAEVLIGADFNKDNPQYSALSVYQDISGGNKQGGSFKPLPLEKIQFKEPELGTRTWLKPQQVKDGWQYGGGAVTGYFGYDPKTNLVYYGTGNPGTWNPDIRPGDNKWTNSIFARDVDTGVAKWAMQATPHDEWDFDATSEVILFDSNLNTYATQVNKNGFVYTWLAGNGTLVTVKKIHPFVNWAIDIDLESGVPAKDPNLNVHQDFYTKKICPSNLGVKGLNPAAYSPKSRLLYVPLNLTCMGIEPMAVKYISGQPWVGAIIVGFFFPNLLQDGRADYWGGFSAINPLSGAISWSKKEVFNTASGALATSGDVVFYSTSERWFKALDANTGRELWKSQLGSSSVGNPFTFSLKGKQFLATYSGFGGWTRIAVDLSTCEPMCGALGGDGEYAQISKFNARPGAGAINVFSL